MTNIPIYDSVAVIQRAEECVRSICDDDIHIILRRAFLAEAGLNAYLLEKCACVYMEKRDALGRFVLMSTGGMDNGCFLCTDADFLTMLETALSRRKDTT